MPCIYSNHLLCQLPSIFPSFILISPQSSLWLFFSCSFFPSHLPRNLPTNRPSLFQKLSKIYIFISREADKKNLVQINIKKSLRLISYSLLFEYLKFKYIFFNYSLVCFDLSWATVAFKIKFRSPARPPAESQRHRAALEAALQRHLPVTCARCHS